MRRDLRVTRLSPFLRFLVLQYGLLDMSGCHRVCKHHLQRLSVQTALQSNHVRVQQVILRLLPIYLSVGHSIDRFPAVRSSRPERRHVGQKDGLRLLSLNRMRVGHVSNLVVQSAARADDLRQSEASVVARVVNMVMMVRVI